MDLKKQIELERAEGDFLLTLMEFNHVSDDAGVRGLIQKALPFAQKVPHYSNWPNDPQQFWNAEALSWRGRIERDVRKGIRRELAFLKGKNLDLGCGSYSYIPNSAALDFSSEMLLINEAQEKITANLEEPLPVAHESFDSVSMVFVANYIRNVDQLLGEAKLALKVGGKLAIVQSMQPAMGLHRTHYKNSYGDAELKVLLKKHKMGARSYVKDVCGRELLFVL